MKGAIQPDHMPVNKYKLLVAGLPELTFTELSGIEDTLQTVDLPDRTVASGGNRESNEFTGMMPLHHIVEQGIMETWYREGQDPVAPTYKKDATLIHFSLSDTVVRTFSITGLFVDGRNLPDLEMGNEGEMAEAEWSFKCDDIEPL